MAAAAAALGYRGIVQMLSSASRGSYRGPSISVDMLSRVLGSTEGLDTAQLVEHTRAAVGSSDTGMLKGGIVESLFTFLAQAAFGEILGRVVDNVGDWFSNRDDSEDIVRDAEAVDKTLCDIEEVNETGVEEILLALRAVIGQLCAFLNQVDPAQHPREFAECVAAGADLIDSAGGTIMDCCRDRDSAVTACLDEFLDRGTAVCEKPATGACATVVCEENPPTAPTKHVPGKVTTVTETPTVPQSTGEPVPEKPVAVEEPDCDPPAPPGKPVATPDCEPTVPQSVEPVEDCPEPVETPEPECVDPPAPGESGSSDCCGVLGLVGVGVAILGVGLLITALEDCIPEIPPAPEPEPEPVPEPVAEPPAPPKQDLTDVPEPPPPPKQAAPPPVAAPAAVPMATAPEPPPAPAPAPGGARKAGAW
ncbi:hypothetical protein EAH68_04445 [Corynebacterium hylobatis]|uniref:Uncharacterized protein n=1 Tax=Corynebacterium hylobatis TaxID=1859290 RepID=A0A430HZ96_9CORY|nr:hypothetical protein [Corynebacterium hylobatis]RSZ64255.1 hypothetical protein EAH68_04445 [Corynebacterium hylobatis]